jgi:hypothetical protein
MVIAHKESSKGVSSLLRRVARRARSRRLTKTLSLASGIAILTVAFSPQLAAAEYQTWQFPGDWDYGKVGAVVDCYPVDHHIGAVMNIQTPVSSHPQGVWVESYEFIRPKGTATWTQVAHQSPILVDTVIGYDSLHGYWVSGTVKLIDSIKYVNSAVHWDVAFYYHLAKAGSTQWGPWNFFQPMDVRVFADKIYNTSNGDCYT